MSPSFEDYDPLDDYHPEVEPSSNDHGDAPTPDPEFDQQPPAEYEPHRGYREDEQFFPVEEYGTYAEHYPEDAERQRQRRETAASRDSRSLPETVLDTLRACFAGLSGRNGSEILELVGFVMSSKHVLGYLDDRTRKTYERLAEVFTSEYCDDLSRAVDFDDIPGADTTSTRVQSELAAIGSRARTGNLPKTPSATWKALVNFVQRTLSRERLANLAAAIDSGGTDDECMDMFRNLEPPSANRTLQNASFSRTAQEWEAADLAAAAEAPGFRISSGYPTLDFAFTQKDAHGRDIEPRGSWGPGELHIIAAPTGNGKSATARKLITAAAEDLVTGWGREHDKVLIAITEESPKIVYTVAGIAKGQPFHHLAGNVVIASVGASRRRFIHALWDCVIDAYHKSQETGLPVTNCGLPSLVVLDYVGGLVEDGENGDTTAVEKTANLLLRGIAAWDVQMQEEFSGESFAAYAGMSWPVGMDAFQPSVIGFAQFRKLADPQWFDPKARHVNMEDFVVPNANGEPGWEVQAGDFRIPTQGEIRGSGILINHATSLIILHRSRPQKNPKIVDKETGRIHLVDDRARWLLIKTRNGSDLPFIEMRFDSIPSGLRGQFFDLRAEKAMGKGLLAPTDCYLEIGDPILPRRPSRTPFDGVSYR